MFLRGGGEYTGDSELSSEGEDGFGGPHLSTVEYPFPHLQGRCVADTLPGPFQLGADGRGDAVQREDKVSEEVERGGGCAGQNGEAEWVSSMVDELLGEDFNRFGHVVVDVSSVGKELEKRVRQRGEV